MKEEKTKIVDMAETFSPIMTVESECKRCGLKTIAKFKIIKISESVV